MAGTVRITCQSHRNDIKHTLKRRLGEVHEIRQSSHGGELERVSETGEKRELKKKRRKEEKKRTRGTREGNEEKAAEIQYFRNLLSRAVLPAHDVVVP